MSASDKKRSSKVAKATVELESRYPLETPRKYIIEDMMRISPSMTDPSELIRTINITTTDKLLVAKASTNINYNFPDSFTDKRILCKISSISNDTKKIKVHTIKKIKNTDNAYENPSIQNEYIFTNVTQLPNACQPPVMQEFKIMDYSFDAAKTKLLKTLDNNTISVGMEKTTYEFAPTATQIKKYSKWSLTNYTSAKHQQEIVILPDTNKVIDELGFIHKADIQSDHRPLPISSINPKNNGFTDRDGDILRNRTREVIRGIVSIHLSQNRDVDRIWRIDFNERQPNIQNYSKKDFYTWVYNEKLADTEKLNLYLEWHDMDYDDKVGKKILPIAPTTKNPN